MPAERPTEQREILVLVVSLCRFAEAIAVGMIIPILPVFLEELSTPFFSDYRPEELTAILYSATGFAMAAIQVVAMLVSDIFDRRKPLILAGMMGATVCSFYFLYLDQFYELLVSRVAQGICIGFTFPPLMAIIAYHAPEGRGGRTLGIYSTIRLFGFATGPLIGGAVSGVWGLHATLAVSAFLLGISVVFVALWVPETRDRQAASVTAERAPRPGVAPGFFVLGGCIFLMMIGISAIISLFPYYRREFNASHEQLGLVFSAFIGTRCLLQYPLGWLGDHLDKKRVLLLALLFAVPLIGLQGYARSISEVILLRVGLGVASAGISSTITGIAAERSVAGNRATVMGINTFSFSLGVAVGPLLGGFLARPDDLAPAFLWPAAGGIVLMMGVAFLVPSDRQWRLVRDHASA